MDSNQSAYQNTFKLKIWGKAQRESARRPKSDWGKLEGGGKEEGRKLSLSGGLMSFHPSWTN